MTEQADACRQADSGSPCVACDGEGVVHNDTDWVDCYECAEKGRTARLDDTDWHVMAQDIAHRWNRPEHVAIAYRAAVEGIGAARKALARDTIPAA